MHGILVPLTGLEPVRYRYRGILSPLRLPVPPQRHNMVIVAQKGGNVNLPAGCFCTKRPRDYPRCPEGEKISVCADSFRSKSTKNSNSSACAFGRDLLY